jgi:hypothetical protein
MKTYLVLMFSLMLAGCSARIPDISSADSALVVVHMMIANRDMPERATLSAGQIVGLAKWLQEHDSGWTRKFEDTAPATEIYLKRSGANLAYVNIHPDFVQVGGLYRSLSADERSTLQAIIDNKNG